MNSVQTLASNAAGASVTVVIDQTSTLTAGAVSFQQDYGDGNLVTVNAWQVVDPTSSTFAPIGLPYTLQASTNKVFLIQMGNAYKLVLKLTTAITGSGTITPYTNLICYTTPAQVNVANTVPVSGTFWQSTQPVSLSSLPSLPSGSNTIGAVTQASGPWTSNVTQINSNTISTAANGVQKVGIVGNASGTLDSAQAASAPANALAVGGVYNTSLPSLSNGQISQEQVDSSGRQITVGAGTAGTPAGGVHSVQGVASMTPLQVSPTTSANGTSNPFFVTGTGTAGSAATNPFTVQGISSMTPLAVSDNTTANSLSNPISIQQTDGTNGPVAVKPAMGTSAFPPTQSTAGATNANPALTVSTSPNSGIPAIIQKTSGTGSGSQASLATSNFTNSVTAGNSLVAVVGVGNSGSVKITDTLSNGWTQDFCTANSTTFQLCVFHATNIIGGTDAVTVTPSASVSLDIAAYEVSGIIGVGGGGAINANSTTNQQNSTDASNSAAGSSASPASGAAIPVLANEIAFGGIAIGTANQTPSAFAPWNKDYDLATGGSPSGLYGLHTFSQPLGAPGSYVSLAATITSEPWSAGFVSFRPAMQNMNVVGNVGIQPALHPASYEASSYFAGSSTTDNATIYGSATSTVFVRRITLSCTQTTAGIQHFSVIKRSAADSGGTSASVTGVPDDANYPGATATVTTYTGTGPSTGSSAGEIDDDQIGCLSASTATPNDLLILDFSLKPIVLRGTGQGIAINTNGAISGGVLSVRILWNEIPNGNGAVNP